MSLISEKKFSLDALYPFGSREDNEWLDHGPIFFEWSMVFGKVGSQHAEVEAHLFVLSLYRDAFSERAVTEKFLQIVEASFWKASDPEFVVLGVAD